MSQVNDAINQKDDICFAYHDCALFLHQGQRQNIIDDKVLRFAISLLTRYFISNVQHHKKYPSSSGMLPLLAAATLAAAKCLYVATKGHDAKWHEKKDDCEARVDRVTDTNKQLNCQSAFVTAEAFACLSGVPVKLLSRTERGILKATKHCHQPSHFRKLMTKMFNTARVQ